MEEDAKVPMDTSIPVESVKYEESPQAMQEESDGVQEPAGQGGYAASIPPDEHSGEDEDNEGQEIDELLL